MLLSGRIGKRNPEWQWLKGKEGKIPQQENKGRSEDPNETSGETDNPPG